MDKEKQLQDEAINISHKQLSFFKPRHGYEPDSNIIQCMMNFAKSDIVKEYHNTDKKYTEEDLHTILRLRREWYSHTDKNVVRDFLKEINNK